MASTKRELSTAMDACWAILQHGEVTLREGVDRHLAVEVNDTHHLLVSRQKRTHMEERMP